MKLSYSTLSIVCPLQLYWKLKWKKVETLPADETLDGIEKHALMRDAIKSDDYSEIAERTEKQAKEIKDIFAMLTGDRETEIHYEYPFDGETIHGYIDLVVKNGMDVLLIDHKSSARTVIEPYHREQLEFYAYALLKQNPHYKVRTAIYFFRWNALVYDDTYSMGNMSTMEKHILRMVNRAKKVAELKTEPKSQVNRMCKYCNYLLSCPIYPSKQIVDNPIATLDEWIKMEAKVKMYRKLTKEIISREGKSIVVGEFNVGYPIIDHLNIDEKGLFLQMVEDGLDPLTIFSANSKNFGKERETYKVLAQFGIKEKIIGKTITAQKRKEEK